MSTFEVVGDQFLLDGTPHRIISGALHYFRIPRAHWGDRIHKARLMGLDTVETYVPWNLHQPSPDTWVDDDELDLGAFLDAVHAEGMHAIVRPGPFICAEFDGGGLPAWLFANAAPTEPAPVRSLDPRFMGPVADYLRRVYDVIVPRQVDRGGPVLLVQVENEYGAYGSDHDYLRALTVLTREAGVTVPLTSVDQPRDHMLEAGSIPELVATGSFGSRVGERLAELRRVRPEGPLMCSEFWDGWFDQVGEFHHTTSPADSAAALDELLCAGASVNIYMFHGGTNFGLTNGANDKGLYRPITTSYDYDAPLDESGHPTPKYWAFREVIARHRRVPEEVPGPRPPAPTPAGAFTSSVALVDVVGAASAWSDHTTPPTMDSLGIHRGMAWYRCACPPALVDPPSRPPTHEGVRAHPSGVLLTVGDVRDRAVVLADGVRVGTLERMDGDHSLVVPAGTRVLDLLVEDLGRVNYGPRIGEHKGIIGPVRLGGHDLTAWRVSPVDLEDLAPVRSLLAPREARCDVTDAAFLRADVHVEEACDLFLDVSAWGHGLVWMNGHPLGRFTGRGPTRTLYVPAAFLTDGDNELLVLECDPVPGPQWCFVEAPDPGPVDW